MISHNHFQCNLYRNKCRCERKKKRIDDRTNNIRHHCLCKYIRYHAEQTSHILRHTPPAATDNTNHTEPNHRREHIPQGSDRLAHHRRGLLLPTPPPLPRPARPPPRPLGQGEGRSVSEAATGATPAPSSGERGESHLFTGDGATSLGVRQGWHKSVAGNCIGCMILISEIVVRDRLWLAWRRHRGAATGCYR